MSKVLDASVTCAEDEIIAIVSEGISSQFHCGGNRMGKSLHQFFDPFVANTRIQSRPSE